jgi:hypothetical protein
VLEAKQAFDTLALRIRLVIHPSAFNFLTLTELRVLFLPGVPGGAAGRGDDEGHQRGDGPEAPREADAHVRVCGLR